MTIAIVTSTDWQGRLVTHSCPATELVGERGSLTLWPRAEKPIMVPWAWVYWLRFKELGGEPSS